MTTLRMLTAALAAAVCFSGPAQAQSRLSLAERVAQLERQAQGGSDSGNLSELMIRNQELQAEVQTLRGLVEEQAFEIENLKKRQRDQYVDLDSRLQRLEGGGMTVPARPEGGALPVEGAPGQLSVDSAAPPATTMPEPPATGERVGGALVEPPPGDEKAAYEEAFESLKQGRYAESSQLFSAFLQQYPDGEYAANASYWLGESYYVTQNYEIALEAFQTLLRRFPNSTKAPDGLLKLGYCQYELRQWNEAEATLNRVMQQYPDTTVARLAQGRLRAMRLEDRR